jgi:hypothetical protein
MYLVVTTNCTEKRSKRTIVLLTFVVIDSARSNLVDSRAWREPAIRWTASSFGTVTRRVSLLPHTPQLKSNNALRRGETKTSVSDRCRSFSIRRSFSRMSMIVYIEEVCSTSMCSRSQINDVPASQQLECTRDSPDETLDEETDEKARRFF